MRTLLGAGRIALKNCGGVTQRGQRSNYNRLRTLWSFSRQTRGANALNHAPRRSWNSHRRPAIEFLRHAGTDVVSATRVSRFASSILLLTPSLRYARASVLRNVFTEMLKLAAA
jgi:hypothetical protein